MKKIYLDTSSLYIYFKDSMKKFSSQDEIPISIQKLKEKRASKIKDAEYLTSCISKYEAFKNLKQEFNINWSQFEKMWNYLVKYLEIKYIRKDVVVKIIKSDLLEDYLNKYKLKSGLSDIIQIIIAKEIKKAQLFTNDDAMKVDWKTISS